MMVGNSSAGIIEAGYFNLPVVNIGTRQGGRIKAENVFDCGYGEEDIFTMIRSMDKMKEAFVAGAITLSMPYGKGNAAKEIVKILDKELHPIERFGLWCSNPSTCGSESGD
jgi:UDP-N-acetylglucosamine 2-epimerase